MTERLPYWPAALRLEEAAAYCGFSPDTFKELCPVKPIEFTSSTRGRRFLRFALDKWLESLDQNDSMSPARRFGDRINGAKSEARRA